MNSGMISRRYARALFIYAKKHGKEKRIFEEVEVLSQTFRQYPDLKRVLSNRVLSKEKKEELVRVAAGGKISPEFSNFIHLLVSKKREDFIRLICLDFQELYKKEKRIMDVELVTAVHIDDSVRQRLIEKLEQLTNGTIRMSAIVDPSILGGYIAGWDTYRIDSSVTTRLKRISDSLTKTIEG